MYEAFQRFRGGDPFPFRQGGLTRTPSSVLDLRPGEVVEVKSYAEILETLNAEGKNRGLLFDREMLKYCGGRFTVLSRVEPNSNALPVSTIKTPPSQERAGEPICSQ